MHNGSTKIQRTIPVMTEGYEIRVCENTLCGLRYPLIKGHPYGERCPACLGNTVAILSRDISPERILSTGTSPVQLEALLDNIRSAWNVGAIFRTSDGFGVKKLFLCGITPTPKNPSVNKTALGAGSTVPWVYSRNALESARTIKDGGSHLWALEQDDRAISVYTNFEVDDKPIALIVGNEVSGVDPDLLDLCERIVYIPMVGKKRSLNVEVAFAVAISALQNAGKN
jgi:23S rRNA (guanosine2251-2'-O)-methyltransferase